MDSIRVARVSPVLLDRLERGDPAQSPTRTRTTGDLHLTPHHLIFIPSPAPATTEPGSSAGPSIATLSVPSPQSEVWIPYPTIIQLQRLPQALDGLYPLRVSTKTFDDYTLWFQRDREGGAEDVWQSVRNCAVASNVEQLYAFFYSLPVRLGASTVSTEHSPLDAPATPPVAAGWSVYNPRAEFARQGVGARTKAWRFTDINRDYSLCPTYPAKLVVPSRISDSVLTYAAKYRSKGRIPALTYLHRTNHASITRSSQPMVGLKNARSAQDERLVDCIFTTHLFPDTAYAASAPLSPTTSGRSTPPPAVYGATSSNLIIDARPTTNAVANVAKGAGTENMDWYKSGKKAYLGIENIHVMRGSLRTVVDAVREADGASLPIDRERLRRSGWLKHVSAILDGALIIVRNIHIYSSHVLVHCSDGWDRTSQLCAVAQVCLDPYFRTLEGFKVLVEKDWLAFGHMFMHRCGHLSSDKLFTATPDNLDEEESDDELGGAVRGAQALLGLVSKQFASNSHLKETSPVFHQFLDCVWQIRRQHPERFQFNEEYLISLHHHLYACQFGTFLFDNERERRTPSNGDKAYVDRTVSAWDWYSLPEQQARFTSSSYDPSLDTAEGPQADQGVLLFDSKDVRFWANLFQRGDAEMNAPRTLDQARGAEFVGPVEAGQADPASIGGVAAAAADELARAASPASSSLPNSAHAITSVPTAGGASRPTDTFRPFASTSSAFSMHAHAGGRSGSPSLPGASLSSSPFAKLRNNLPAGGSQWGWAQLGTGAMSAIYQIKSISADAIGQLRAEAAEAGEHEAVANVRAASLAGMDPWSTPAVVEARPTNEAPSGHVPTYSQPLSSPAHDSQANSFPRATLPAPSARIPAPAPAQRQPSWTANPWSDPTDTRPSLADLSLDGGARRTVPAGSASAAPAEIAASGHTEAATNDGMVQAAMGGERKAWDPLGAL